MTQFRGLVGTFAVYGVAVLTGMLLLLVVGYVLWAGVLTLFDSQNGALLAVVFFAFGLAAAAGVLGGWIASIVLLRRRVRLDVTVLGHALHLDFGERL